MNFKILNKNDELKKESMGKCHKNLIFLVVFFYFFCKPSQRMQGLAKGIYGFNIETI